MYYFLPSPFLALFLFFFFRACPRASVNEFLGGLHPRRLDEVKKLSLSSIIFFFLCLISVNDD